MQMGGVCLVTWTVLCFQFHTHQSLQHSKASRYFQTVAELHLSVQDLCPSKPCPFAQIEIDMRVHMHKCSQPVGIPLRTEGLMGKWTNFHFYRTAIIIGGSCHKCHFCCNKHVFVITKHIFCRNKTSGTTDILVLRNFCHDKYLVRQT